MIIRSFLTCISLCVIFLTKAQTGIAYSQLADSLYRQSRYFEASIAYERLLFGNDELSVQLSVQKDDHSLQGMAVLGKTACLKKQGLYDQAVTFLEAWQAFPFADTILSRIHYQQVLCSYLGGHFENTLSLVDRWPFTHKGQSPAPLLVVLKILSLNELQRWKEAGETYRGFVSERGDTLVDLYEHLPKLKSVTKAQWLSTFIPGGGQFYAGKPCEALFSILVQTAGIYFGIVSFQQHYYVSAWLVGAALFGAFHMGGVRRAETLVRQYNRKKVLQFNEKVREQLLQLVQ